MHYALPWGWWLLGATASHNRYHQSVAGASQTYRYSGASDNAELRLSRVVYRDAVRKTTLFASGWWRRSQNFIDDAEVTVQRRAMAGWEAGLSHHDAIAAATLDASLAYRRGTGAWGAQPAPEEAFGEGSSRAGIAKAEAQLNWPWQWGAQRLRASLAWRAQWNRAALVPQDRLAIGNRYTVRGFDGETTLAGDRGWLLRGDLAWALPAGAGNGAAPSVSAELYLGLDHGEVGGASAAGLLGQRLSGGVRRDSRKDPGGRQAGGRA